MRISENVRLLTIFLMVFLMSNVSSLAAIESFMAPAPHDSMLSTASVVTELNETDRENSIHKFLDQPEVQSELVKQGVSPDELKQRLASLSDAELRQLSLQVSEARFGGDILVTILLVLLIIYIFKRI